MYVLSFLLSFLGLSGSVGCSQSKGSCFSQEYESDIMCTPTESQASCFDEIVGAAGGGWRAWSDKSCGGLASCENPFDPFSENSDSYYCEDLPDGVLAYDACFNVEEGNWYLGDEPEKCTPCDETSEEPEYRTPLLCQNNLWIASIW